MGAGGRQRRSRARAWAGLAGLAALALVLGCYSGERRPLFGEEGAAGPVGPQAPSPPVAAAPQLPPAPPAVRGPADELLAELRARGGQRGDIVTELVRRGPDVRPALEAAIAEERLLLDLLEDVRRRVDPAAVRSDAPLRGLASPWVAGRYRLALDRYAAGDHLGALRIVDALLILEPDSELRQQLLRLRRGSRERLLRESVLVAEVVPRAETVALDEPLSARIRLRNVGDRPVELRLGGRTVLGTLALDYEQLSPSGAHTRERIELPIRSDGDLALAPGRSHELAIELPSPHRGQARDSVGRYRLQGMLRPAALVVGETRYSAFVPLLEVVVLAVAPGDRGGSPEEAFWAAVQAGPDTAFAGQAELGRRAFVAAILWERDDRGRAIAALAAALEDARGPLADALCAALGRLTGEPLGFTREEWLAWWRGREARPR